MLLLVKSFASAGHSSKSNYSYISTNTEIFSLHLQPKMDGHSWTSHSDLVFMVSNQKPINNFENV